MRLMVLTGVGQGGAERQAIETANVFFEHGQTVGLLAVGLKRRHFAIMDGIQVFALDNRSTFEEKLPPTLKDIISLYRIRKAIKRFKPDVVLAFTTKLNLAIGMVRVVINSDAIFLGSERSSQILCSKNVFWWCACRLLFRKLDGILVNSTVTGSKLSQAIVLEPRKLRLLRNVVDIDHFRRPLSKPIPRFPHMKQTGNEEPLKILVPARICFVKNQQILPDVSKKLVERGIPNHRFILAGENQNNYAETLYHKINSERIASKFSILGAVPDIRELYWASHIVLLVSLWEGFPNVVLEALASETIVITTNVSDISQVFDNGKDLFILADADPDEIADTIARVALLAHSDREVVAQTARLKSLEFSKERYYQNTLRIFTAYGEHNVKSSIS